MKFKKIVSSALISLMILSSVSFANEIPTRDQIEDQYKWKLDHIYKTSDEFYSDLEKLSGMVDDFLMYEGKLNTESTVIKAVKDKEKMDILAQKLVVFANMSSDTDTNNTEAAKMVDKIDSALTDMASKHAFYEVELLENDKSFLEKLASNSDLEGYDFYFTNLAKNKDNALSKGEERILALASEMAATPEKIYEAYDYKDRKIKKVKDENGNEVSLGSSYSTLLESKNREVRKNAFIGEFSSYDENINTVTAALVGEVKSNIFYAKARGYNSALEASLDNDNVKPEVYESFVNAVNNNLDSLHRYISLRKKLLKIEDKVHYYDLYAPIVDSTSDEISYEDAKEMVAKALSPLGEQYVKDLKAGLAGGWVDVYENKGKYSGAYSWGGFATHPYVLLNYNGNLNAVSTLAHEMGHALNSYYSNKTQPYAKADYPIFTAEVASTTNEAIMLDYLIKNAKTKEEKLYLINNYLEQIRGSIYSQIMYAEFEKMIHEAVENGQTVDATAVKEMWGGLMAKYYGDDFEVDELAKVWWARVPHFYWNFYVYKYATGLSSGIIISENVMNGDQEKIDAYLDFLAGGGSNYPIEMLKATGVDLSSPQPVENALKKFDSLLDEFESLLDS
ncbi:MAG: oligoendopeptidase F [Peptostreptococcaceae bacterium]|jgi:oligoendopeptidase F|nr:oligoendopeptidase F [Peptostreptococcaceae bacterium]